MSPTTTTTPNPADAGFLAPATPPGPLILVAEDDREMRELLRLTLERAGYAVTLCPHGLDLLVHLTEPAAAPPIEEIALVISDLRMPGVSGLEVVCGLRQELPLPPVILITAFGDVGVHAEARRLGVRAVLDKPFDMGDLLTIVREVLPSPPTGVPPGALRTQSAPEGIPASGVVSDSGLEPVPGGPVRSRTQALPGGTDVAV